jgi:hypothetical protein
MSLASRTPNRVRERENVVSDGPANPFEYQRKIVDHFVVTESNDSTAMLFQPLSACKVSF